MSQENVAIVQRAWGLWSRGDVDELLAHLDEDVVFDTTHVREWPESAYVGHAEFRRFLTEWLEVWDAFEVGAEEFIPAPDGRVVVFFWQRGTGRRSGLAMDVKWAQIATVRHGKPATLEQYDNRQAALKAVGLAE